MTFQRQILQKDKEGESPLFQSKNKNRRSGDLLDSRSIHVFSGPRAAVYILLRQLGREGTTPREAR